MSYGYVYCMTNESIPNLCKIGFVNSGNTSHSRAALLSNASVPLPFIVEFDIKVYNPHKYEKILHSILKPFHFKKEFFKCKSDNIIKFFNYETLYKYDKTVDIDDFADNYLTIYNKPNVDININNIEEEYTENKDLIIQIDTQSSELLQHNLIEETPIQQLLNDNEITDSINKTRFDCVFCNKYYENYNSLYSHYRSKHDKEYRNRYNKRLEQSKMNKCNICGIVLNNKSAKYRHMIKCTEELNTAHKTINNIQKIKNEPELNNKIDKLIDAITSLKTANLKM